MGIYLSLQIVMVHWDINKSYNVEYLVEQRTNLLNSRECFTEHTILLINFDKYIIYIISIYIYIYIFP